MEKQLKCAECTKMFEVSDKTAEAMHRWREQSGEPFTCGECAGVDDIVQDSSRHAPRAVHRKGSA